MECVKNVKNWIVLLLLSGGTAALVQAQNEQVYVPSTQKIGFTTNDFRTVEDILKLYRSPATDFFIDPNKDTMIVLPQGTAVKFHSGSLRTDRGEKPKGKVLIKANEFYKASDMFLARLSTHSDENILQTAGMLHLEAWDEGNRLQLTQGTTIDIKFAGKLLDNDYQLYQGRTDRDRLNWTPLVSPCKQPQEVFLIVEEMPRYRNGGDDGLMKDLQSALLNEGLKLKSGEEAVVVYLSFVISEEGKILNPLVRRGIDPEIDAAVIRAVGNLGNWIPGKQRGKPVNVQYNLPVALVGLQAQMFDAGSKADNGTGGGRSTDLPLNDREPSRRTYCSTSMDWINLDILFKSNTRPIAMRLNLPDKGENVYLALAFKDLGVLLEPSIGKPRYTYTRLPEGQKYLLLAIFEIGGTYYLGKQWGKVSSTKVPELTFAPLTEESLLSALADLDRQFAIK